MGAPVKSQRIHIDLGVSIYLWKRVWWVDISPPGQKRCRRPLGTKNRNHAMVLARNLAGEITSGRWNIALAGVTTFDKAIEQYKTA